MFCPKCGNEIPDDAQFCGRCGSVVGNRGDASKASSVPQAPQRSSGSAMRPPSEVPALSKSGNSKTFIMIAAVVALVVIVIAVIFGLVTCGSSSSSSSAAVSSSSSTGSSSSSSASSSASSGGSNGYSHSERVTGSDNVPGLSIQNVQVSRSGGDYNVDAKVYNSSSTYAYKDVKAEVTLIDATGRALAKATVDVRPVSSSGIIGESSGSAIIKAAMAYAGTASSANVKIVSATRLSN